ncbi:MotA/TolQ/ExbB proton channel family protein [Lentisphaera profundi]|uniref:MotA/TolQ/ExbB proton channel family protein n=1 Tax=Lentisphaera profundi TaxID=1658616 RepID=A0ABY7VWE5_9BACT|nr:MotA/TolQ/ExbB proton channel family protein [Lentisphaera profundi]WDE97212.1 MotA/TolQ/ExbB proton channel family protein [Lentisphaera profundi]
MNYWQTIINMWSDAGWFSLALWFLSVISWIYLLRVYQKLKHSWFNTSHLSHEITHLLLDGKSKEEVRLWLCQKSGLIPHIINYVLATKDHRKITLQERYEEASICEVTAIHKEFGVVDALVKSAPLLGLLGTVAGMIQTFAALSQSGDITLVSQGISKALLTTQLGLLIALPGVFASAYLKRKFLRLSTELERLIYHIAKLGNNPQDLAS